MKLNTLFNPRSIAIIGASNSPGKVGFILTKNMIECGYSGEIYPINPGAEEIQGLKCYPSVLDVSSEIDLVVIAIPANRVLNVVEECGRKGVKALIIISAGFKEAGREGAILEKKLVEICHKYGMRLQGPNCLGIIDTITPINLSFARTMPKRGGIGFISQSGALGTAVLDWAIKEEIGISSFISLGNKADLDEVEFIEAMGEREEVKVILLYLESIERGQKFIEIAKKIVKKKPIIVLKGGVSTAGARAAGSHTGALVGSFIAYRTAFKKAGVIFAESVEELFNYASAFVEQPLPGNGGVAIVTNAGGPGILVTDLCEKLGVPLATLSKTTRQELASKLPSAASLGNPIDILGDAMADRYEFALEKTLQDDSVNSVIVLLTPQAMTESMGTAEKIVEIRKKRPNKPILTVFMGGYSVNEASTYLKDNKIPCYDFPEKAVKTISTMLEYSRILGLEEEQVERFTDVDKARVEIIFQNARIDKRNVLLPHEAAEAVEAYGINVPKIRVARTSEEAIKFADELGYPIVLKIVSPDILHKTDIGGVVLNLKSPEEVRISFEEIMSRVSQFMPHARIYGIMVYKMLPSGREMIVGMSRDVQFGPLLMFGLGGIYVNILKDVSFGLAPLTKYEVDKMVEDTKAYTLLKGIRGEPPSDIQALKETILRVSQFILDFPQILEMDINPIIVYQEGRGCIALDVKITLTLD
ncbi:acetate--CoA ligase family protein [Candidatus Bathyarchaeota archaeon]|nr:acetate--CoA ligase family protein [Candidatus Bathyarchaeota archaeon]